MSVTGKSSLSAFINFANPKYPEPDTLLATVGICSAYLSITACLAF